MIFPAYSNRLNGYITPQVEERIGELMKAEAFNVMQTMPVMPPTTRPPVIRHAKEVDVEALKKLAAEGVTHGVAARRLGHNEHRIERVCHELGINIAKARKGVGSWH